MTRAASEFSHKAQTIRRTPARARRKALQRRYGLKLTLTMSPYRRTVKKYALQTAWRDIGYFAALIELRGSQSV
jgi:hypothetical protein